MTTTADIETQTDDWTPLYPVAALLSVVPAAMVVTSLWPSWVLPAMLWLTALGALLSIIDIQTHRLPNALVLPAYPITAGLLLLPVVMDGAWANYAQALLGGAALFGFYLVLALTSSEMGMGDVKLAGVLGMALGWFGWSVLMAGTVYAFVAFGVVGIYLLMARRIGRGASLPFGPFMLAGALLAILTGTSG